MDVNLNVVRKIWFLIPERHIFLHFETYVKHIFLFLSNTIKDTQDKITTNAQTIIGYAFYLLLPLFLFWMLYAPTLRPLFYKDQGHKTFLNLCLCCHRIWGIAFWQVFKKIMLLQESISFKLFSKAVRKKIES